MGYRKLIVIELIIIAIGVSLIGYLYGVAFPQYHQRTDIIFNNFSEANGVKVSNELHMDSVYVKVDSLSAFLELAKASGVAYRGPDNTFFFGSREVFTFHEGIWYSYKLTVEEWLNR